MSGRRESITERVSADFGAHYVHVEHDGGRVLGLSISSPGKFDSTTIADLLAALSDTANRVIADIAGTQP